MSQEICFKTLLGSQCVDCSETLLKSEREQFFPVVSFLWVKVRFKTFFLVTCELLGLFLNTLISDGKYSSYKRETLPQAI